MITRHGGRIIDTAGDGILAEFSSVLNAVECALTIQRTMAQRNAGVEETRRMHFRIGINHGDVVFDDARIYGDGVNIAARLETIAKPGGICISRKVYEEITGKMQLAFIDLGEHQLKNIAQPVRVCRIAGEQLAVPRVSVKSALALPDNASIAVLPFTNMSGDPEQEYFADGMVEEIITALSRIRWLFVIARNSSFTYKGQAVDVRQVGRELGVLDVLEGLFARLAIASESLRNCLMRPQGPISGPRTSMAPSRMFSSFKAMSQCRSRVQLNQHCKRRNIVARSSDRPLISPHTTYTCKRVWLLNRRKEEGLCARLSWQIERWSGTRITGRHLRWR
jgi:hypothetical protein